MYKLTVTELADDDLDSIVKYTAIDLDNPIAAGDFLKSVDKCFDNLRFNPLIYPKSSDPRLEKEGYCKALVKNYILLFKVYEDEKSVVVHRVFYAARDYTKLL